MEDQIKTDILQLIGESRDAFVCSVDELGFPNVKAMFLAKHEGYQTLWFSTNVSAARTSQWKNNNKASVYFYDGEHIHGLMLVGQMEVLTDDETKLAFWKPGDEQYYSLGATDPDYCILRFSAETGNYWGQKKYLFHV